MNCNQRVRLFLGAALACMTLACAAIQPPETGGPRSGGPPYPVVFTEQSQRTQASVVEFDRLFNRPAENAGGQPVVQLNPITAAIRNLPTGLNTPLYLPKIGVEAEMTEEDIRESLRRFINDWQVLIGANPAHLSLVERTDRPDGLKVAKYEQRPFRYPLRGGYGLLEIQFLANRVLRNLTSTCIPDAERLQAALTPIVPRVTADEAIKQVRGTDIAYTDSTGRQITYRVTPTDEVNAVELVTFVVPATGRTDALELHIAWEMSVGTAPRRLVYLDAVDGKIVGAAAVP